MIKRAVFLLFCISCCSFFVKAQRTNVYVENDGVFKNAYHLFTKQKYAQAQQLFEKYIHAKNKHLTYVSDAKFYSALCAFELFNEDAEQLLVDFINQYPESPKIKMAYFTLGSWYYRKKKYKESIQFFEKTETHDLTNEQLAEYYFKLGYSYFEEKNYDRALINLKEVKEVENKYKSVATYYFAHINYLQKNYTTALNEFLKLTNDAQFSHIVPYYVAQLYYLLNEYEQVIAYAPALLDSANTKRAPEIARILGESYYKTNRFKEAIPYLLLYKEKGATMQRCDYYQLGYAYYKIADYANAVNYFKEVTDQKDSLTQLTLYNLAECYLKLNKKELARSNFQACSKLNFDQTIREDAFFNYAKLAYELDFNPFEKTVIAFEAYLNEYPQSPRRDEAYSYLLNVYLTTRNYAAALASMEKIKQWDEPLKYAYQRVAYNRAIELYNNTDYINAIELFNKSLKYPLNKTIGATAVYWKGEAYYKLNQLREAIQAYKDFIYQPGAVLTGYFYLVNYNLGYAYYTLKDYANAILWFRKYTSNPAEADKKRLNDAYLRIADSYFITKDYRNAYDNYQSAYSIKLLDPDYTLLQMSLAAGLLNKTDEKERGLKNLLSEYPTSKYKSDALYELGNYYLAQGNNEQAIYYFNQLEKEFLTSSYLKNVLLKKGLIYKNANNDAEAIALFKQVINNYPNTTEANDALYQIKFILLENGQVEEWESFAKNQNISAINVNELDSASFEAANKKYSNNDWAAASEAFGNYLKKYPNGIFKIHATYYKAECDYQLKNQTEAYNGYSQFLNFNKNRFTEPALLKASYIAMKNKNYTDAANLYQKLEQIAEIKSNITDARIGLMRCYKQLNKYNELKKYAELVLNNEKTAPELEREARFNLATALLNLNDTTAAIREFTDLADKTNSEIGATARYQVAELLYLKNNLSEAEKNAFLVINHDPSYDYLVAKSFILLADIMIARKEILQAKQTLQSIIDNYEGEDLVKIARQKMENILEIERQKELLKPQPVIEINLMPENGIDEKLFEEETKKEPVIEENIKYE